MNHSVMFVTLGILLLNTAHVF